MIVLSPHLFCNPFRSNCEDQICYINTVVDTFIRKIGIIFLFWFKVYLSIGQLIFGILVFHNKNFLSILN